MDVGQANDFSAIVGIERRPEGSFVRYAQRLALGTPYSAIAGHVGAMVQDRRLTRARVAIDATGVGRPVVERFRELLPGTPVSPVVITGGGEAPRQEGAGWHVPQSQLIANLAVAADAGRLKIAARLPGREILESELRAFRWRTSRGGESAEGRGEHDDLIFSMAIAQWIVTRSHGAAFAEFLRGEYRSIYGREFEQAVGDPDDPFILTPPIDQRRRVGLDYFGRPYIVVR